jgi:hypothetical protein
MGQRERAYNTAAHENDTKGLYDTSRADDPCQSDEEEDTEDVL